MNNYAGALYIQGACIFMQGVVMECMVRLVRLGVGGNFFHTLGYCFHCFHRVFQFRLYQCSPSNDNFFTRIFI